MSQSCTDTFNSFLRDRKPLLIRPRRNLFIVAGDSPSSEILWKLPPLTEKSVGAVYTYLGLGNRSAESARPTRAGLMYRFGVHAAELRRVELVFSVIEVRAMPKLKAILRQLCRDLEYKTLILHIHDGFYRSRGRGRPDVELSLESSHFIEVVHSCLSRFRVNLIVNCGGETIDCRGCSIRGHRPPTSVKGALGNYFLLEDDDYFYSGAPRRGYSCQGYAIRMYLESNEPRYGTWPAIHVYVLRHEPRYGTWPATLIFDGAAADLTAQLFLHELELYKCRGNVSYVYLGDGALRNEGDGPRHFVA